MFTVTCPVSGASAVVACACDQVGHDPAAAGAHHGRCQMNNLTANVHCPPEAGCCPEDHDHEAAANACPGGHGPCPEPGSCRLHASVKAHHAAMIAHAEADHGPQDTWADQGLTAILAAAAQPPPGDCPGGHCHKDLADCTACHPVIITAGIGAAVLRPVATS